MSCRISDCEKPIHNKSRRLCQMHYCRYRRHGTYSLTMTARRKITNPAGYIKIHKPEHPLADSTYYVYQHRLVYYKVINSNPTSCEICGSNINWGTAHIDHIDRNVSNNHPKNLQALCCSCNVWRGRVLGVGVKYPITIGGITLSAGSWAMFPGIKLTGRNILRRKKEGWKDYDCVFSPRQTWFDHESAKAQTEESANLRGLGNLFGQMKTLLAG